MTLRPSFFKPLKLKPKLTKTEKIALTKKMIRQKTHCKYIGLITQWVLKGESYANYTMKRFHPV
jgi:hypothetical protein